MRRCLYWAVTLLATALWLVTVPSQAADSSAVTTSQKTVRIGMLLYRGETDAERGFRQYLQQKGLKAEFIVRDAAEDPKRLPALVEEMRALKLDLIYTFGTSATIAVVGKVGQKPQAPAIADIPVVFNIVAEPVRSGITNSLSGSDRNVTGVSHLVPMNSQISALRAAMNCKQIAVIYSANEKNAALSADALESEARNHGLQVRRYPIGSSEETTELRHLNAVLDRVIADKSEIVYVPSDSFLIKHADVVGGRLKRARIPTMSATESPILKDGLVMGLVSPYYNAGAFAGHKAYQILIEGRDPGTLPISGLDKFTFLINMRSALDTGFYPKIGALGFAEVIGLSKKP